MKPGRMFVITLRKGGVGKTTVAMNLAIYLRQIGRSVAYLDLDPQQDGYEFFKDRTHKFFIGLSHRRRLRVNGPIKEVTPTQLTLQVQEAFPNCPQFIRDHTLEGLQGPAHPAQEATHGTQLGSLERTRIEETETLFVATLHPERGVDASHRGGPRGFVEVVNATTLRLPDYPGNGLFNSFGNLAVDPRMGMLIPVFATGELLHLSGRGKVLWEAADPGDLTLGSRRFLAFSLEQWNLTPAV